jgi:hypothetical protein
MGMLLAVIQIFFKVFNTFFTKLKRMFKTKFENIQGFLNQST